MDESKQQGKTLGHEAQSFGISREKYWGEIGIEEKLERMRGIIKSQGQQIEAMQELLTRTVKIATQHEHAGDGRPVLLAEGLLLYSEPQAMTGSGFGRMGRLKGDNPDEVYF